MKKRKRRMMIPVVIAFVFSFIPFAVLAEKADAQQGLEIEQSAAQYSAEKADAQQGSAVEQSEALYSGTENEELLMEYMENEVRVSSEPAYSVYGYSHLSGIEKKIYELLLGKIEEVANGTTTSATFQFSVKDLGMDRAYSAEELGLKSVMSGLVLSQAAKDALSNKLNSFSLKRLHVALLVDCPATLFWYDKTIGISRSFSYGYKAVANSKTGKMEIAFKDTTSVTFSFVVAQEFAKSQETGTFETDEAKIQSVQSAIETARNIVTEESEKADYNKLKAFKDRICEMTSYNSEAAGGGQSYGNPWQMIWVFDGDPDTKVVCEGYSKAFQFLCDTSTFQNENVTSRIVSGNMTSSNGSGGGHMWNVVTAGNGKNYLVDVTNCDGGSIGAPDQLFLAPCAGGDSESGYDFSCRRGQLHYLYDDSTLLFYEPSELEIAGDPCPVCRAGHMGVTDEAVAPTCAKTGLTEGSHCAVCSEVIKAQEEVPKKEHTPVTDEAVAPTCAKTGLTEGSHCAVCSEVIKAQEEVPKKEHTPVTDEAVAPTCAKTGLTEGSHCAVCSEVIKAQEEVPKKEHTPVTDEAVAPTCAKTGLTEGSHCAVCGEVLVAQKTVPKKPVMFRGKKVLVSGQVYTVTKPAAKKSPGTVTFTKAKNAKSVSVPRMVKLEDGRNYLVTEVAAGAFTGSKIRMVTIASNVRCIKPNAFKRSRATTLILKTARLTAKRVRNCLKGSRVQTIVVKISSSKGNKAFVKKYKRIFTKKHAGKTVKVK